MRPVAVVTAVLSAAALVLSFAYASAGEPDWLPKPAHGKGTHCVAPTAWMRRNHMTALLDHRHEVVHEGIRTQRFAITGCVNCHAVKGADGKFVSYSSPKHFCRTCHDYAAVQIDCFECHASRPEAKTATARDTRPPHAGGADGTVLAQYLRSLKP